MLHSASYTLPMWLRPPQIRRGNSFFSSFPCPPGRLVVLATSPNALPSASRCPTPRSELGQFRSRAASPAASPRRKPDAAPCHSTSHKPQHGCSRAPLSSNSPLLPCFFFGNGKGQLGSRLHSLQGFTVLAHKARTIAVAAGEWPGGGGVAIFVHQLLRERVQLVPTMPTAPFEATLTVRVRTGLSHWQFITNTYFQPPWRRH